jgi:hypothetical protein
VWLAAVERWFLRAGVFALPLGFGWNTFDQYVLPKLLIARVILLGLLILFVARVALSGTVHVKRTPLDLPLLALLASAAVSTFFAENQNVAIFGTCQPDRGPVLHQFLSEWRSDLGPPRRLASRRQRHRPLRPGRGLVLDEQHRRPAGRGLQLRRSRDQLSIVR